MDFTKFSDIGFFDGLQNLDAQVFIGVTVLAFGLVIFWVVREMGGFKAFKEPWVIALVAVSVVFSLIVAWFVAHETYEREVGDVRYENITKVFDVSDDNFEKVKVQNHMGRSVSPEPFKDGNFADLEATIKDRDSETLHKVTFGFEESGEPFIYETGEVSQEFIESLRK